MPDYDFNNIDTDAWRRMYAMAQQPDRFYGATSPAPPPGGGSAPITPYYSGINPSYSGYNGTAPNQTLPKTGQMMKYQKPGAARSLFTPSIFGGTQQQKQKTPKQPYYGMTENVSYRRPERQQLARAAEALGYEPSPEQMTPEMEQYLKFIEQLKRQKVIG